MSLPSPVFDVPAENFSPPLELGCDPTPKPGVIAFRDFVLDRLGGNDAGIVRDCSAGKPSYHHMGSAWDWHIEKTDPTGARVARELLDWLLADDAELFRRAGLRYVIWDREIWTPTHGWRHYNGASAHRTHMHLSFGREGAAGQTSLYDWIARGAPSARALGSGTAVAAATVGLFWLVTRRIR